MFSDIFWFVHSFPKHLKCLVESLNLEKYFPARLSGGHLSYSQDVSNLLYGATTTLYAFSGTYLNSPPYSVFVVVLTTAQEDACWVSFPSTLMRYHPEERWGLVWKVLQAIQNQPFESSFIIIIIFIIVICIVILTPATQQVYVERIQTCFLRHSGSQNQSNFSKMMIFRRNWRWLSHNAEP